MTALISLDFRQNRYLVEGGERAINYCIEEVVGYDFSFADVVPGLGLVASVAAAGTYASYPALTQQLKDILAFQLQAGITITMDFWIEATDSGNSATVTAVLANAADDASWLFTGLWTPTGSGNGSSIGDSDGGASLASSLGTQGRHRLAATFTQNNLSASIDGGATAIFAGPLGLIFEWAYISVQAIGLTGDDARAIIEKIEYMPAVDDDDLPSLSEPDSDGLYDTSVRIRSWGYSLDGHDKVVWRLGPTETLEFDVTTQSWAGLESPGRTNWRPHCGQNWIGMSTDTIERGYGSDIVVGDDASGVLFILDPAYGRDDRATTGDDAFNRVATGGFVLSGRETIPCGALQLDYSAGNPAQSGATFTLETSDDWGNTFDDHGTVTITADDFAGVVEWRALGHARHPGRVFRITDNGAAIRLSGAELR